MIGGRFLRSYPYVRQELQIIPLIVNKIRTAVAWTTIRSRGFKGAKAASRLQQLEDRAAR